MDRSKVRIGLFTTGIIAGLTLILYLPVLIWSPPWGENGYFINYSDKESRELESIIFHFQNNKTTWLSIDSDGNLVDAMDLLGLDVETRHPAAMGFQKICNPFTLWYIKWLDWNTNKLF